MSITPSPLIAEVHGIRTQQRLPIMSGTKRSNEWSGDIPGIFNTAKKQKTKPQEDK